MKDLCVWIISRLTLVLLFVFVYNGGVINFINWYMHSLDFMNNEILELSILFVISASLNILAWLWLWYSGGKDQKKNLD